jgi:ubiquinone biosynthesis protein UbiJ
MLRHRNSGPAPHSEQTKYTLFERLSEMLNRAIKLDEKTQYRLGKLGSCSIAFKLRHTEALVLVTIREGVLSLSGDLGTKPDVQIEGGLSDFIAMVRTQREGTTLAAGKVEIQGDLASAQLIQTVIAEADFDWEELIAHRTGDVIARQIGRGLRGGINWGRSTATILERNLGEYLLYEQRMLPTEKEIESFVQDGTAIASGVERLNARISRIRQKRELS